MNWFYFGMNLKARPGDEMFGISFGKFYFGYYRPGHSPESDGWGMGFLDENDVLIQNWIKSKFTKTAPPKKSRFLFIERL